MPVRPATPPATLPVACPASCPAACAQPLLHLDALCWSAPFPGALILFDRLTLQAGAGVLGVIGDEGRGKSALLRLIAGELRPDAGSILIGAPADPVAPRQRLFWCDPQSDRHDGLVARDYLAMQRQGRPGWSEAALAAQLEGFALHEHLDKRLEMLSTGTRRKLRLAAALASGATLVLLDDPGAALDARSQRHLAEALRQHHDAPAGRLIVVTGHDDRLMPAVAPRLSLD
ncbi:ABC-type multidrug transport system ATPase subunit [Sphaerotilus sulfidivorans]|uniref:ABC-type multidrug transport system ATPase subunit n=1 Tax=Sphaerotilus sulfidivorans TaxID=639200 RepID=A0A5C1Q245_9BURK|nr:ATP-binding cassette domain-containing protein [Sphaerotilus sulfidivorans]NZD46509.1 ATP-binding cassette domain-containing protein [Sphaerotilus sulfidivorans]QEN00664.1 ATP-binding cassette domain-containing protein [Sphaerotilus sulfidivorans]